jgi:hypothetical protein
MRSFAEFKIQMTREIDAHKFFLNRTDDAIVGELQPLKI